jgi:hypothetical protein
MLGLLDNRIVAGLLLEFEAIQIVNVSIFTHCRYIQSTCATSGEGLYEGLDWLSNNIANKVLELHYSLINQMNISTLIDFKVPESVR